MRSLALIILLAAGGLAAPASNPSPHSYIRAAVQHLGSTILYYGMGKALESLSLWGWLSWGVCQISPWASTRGKECRLLGSLCNTAAEYAFMQMFKGDSHNSKPSPLSSWHRNQALLSQVPAHSNEEKEMLLFLERRWLAKATGFFAFVVDRVCPCFDVDMQVHPETTSGSYARAPKTKFSQTYTNRVESWKEHLPQPGSFPLVLTRPAALGDYLPSYHAISPSETVRTTAERLLSTNELVIVDVTELFPEGMQDPSEWLKIWKSYEAKFSKISKELSLNSSEIIWVQRVKQGEIGGMRILPFSTRSQEDIEKQHRFLMEWVSDFGLSANRVELDRLYFPSEENTAGAGATRAPLVDLLSDLDSFERSWKSEHPEKRLMVEATLKLFRGLFASISPESWDRTLEAPSRSAIARFTLSRIKDQLNALAKEEDSAPFFKTATHIEEMHASLSALLELFAPFTFKDFPTIYNQLLTSIPPELKPLTSYTLHSSAMTSMAGIFKAAQKSSGKPPRILYGENAYFECINTARRIGHAKPIDEATEEDWKEVDLILAEFNPALKRIDVNSGEYRLEKIGEYLEKTLDVREGKPVTLALDCTFDLINSSRVSDLLKKFQKEIIAGTLNIVCYQSGLKFDLLGMDNYCGAPLYAIHNASETWTPFNKLLSDPVLQTDRLSLNWFCLAYTYAHEELEQYRNQIFANTRALLKKVPARLLEDPSAAYRIVPVLEEADPTFIDIRISGLLHQIRGSALAGGSLYLKCMSAGHPVFYRPSVGFYHPNYTMIFGEKSTIIRLTVGLDPSQVDILADCFKMIDTLNGS